MSGDEIFLLVLVVLMSGVVWLAFKDLASHASSPNYLMRFAPNASRDSVAARRNPQMGFSPPKPPRPKEVVKPEPIEDHRRLEVE